MKLIRWVREDPSLFALIGANLIPLFGVLLGGWQPGTVLITYWAESFIIGAYTVLKILVVGWYAVQRSRGPEGTRAELAAAVMAFFLAPFFCVHYGGFMAAHLLFISLIAFPYGGAAGLGIQMVTALSLISASTAIALVISHGSSFLTNFLGKREYQTLEPAMLAGSPYERVVLMHLVILFGGFLTLSLHLPALIMAVFVAGKIIADIHAHLAQHAAHA